MSGMLNLGLTVLFTVSVLLYWNSHFTKRSSVPCRSLFQLRTTFLFYNRGLEGAVSKRLRREHAEKERRIRGALPELEIRSRD